MASAYVYNINLFNDFILELLKQNINIADKKIKNEIKSNFKIYLKNILEDENDISYLDFNIVKECGIYKIIGNNFISALWLSGLFVDDVKLVLENDKVKIGNKKYSYNNKTKKLIVKNIDN